MRRNWRGRYRNNWYRSRNQQNSSNSDNQSVHNSTRPYTTASTSRAPANQLPIIVPINAGNNVWSLYLPTQGMCVESNQHNCEINLIQEHIHCTANYVFRPI